MMARPKRPTRISATDPNFVRRLEFNLPEERLAAVHDDQSAASAKPPAETEKAAEKPDIDARSAQRNAQTVGRNTQTVERSAESGAAISQTTISTETTSAAKPRVPRQSKKSRGVPTGSEKSAAVVRLSFGLPARLVSRAEVWAEKARCPVNSIIQRVFRELRPDLVSKLEEGIKHKDITQERAVDAQYRFNTTVTISAEASHRLTIELDPEGISGLSASLSRWAREEMIKHLDVSLSDKGY